MWLSVGPPGVRAVDELDEEGPVPGGRVAVLPAHRPVCGGLGPVVCVLGAAGAALLCYRVAGLGQPVAVLGLRIALVRPRQPDGDLLQFRGAPVPGGLAIVSVGLAVPAVSDEVAFFGGPVPRISGSVPRISGSVPSVGGTVGDTSPGRGSPSRG